MPSGMQTNERFGFELEIWIGEESDDFDDDVPVDSNDAVRTDAEQEAQTTLEVEQTILADTVLDRRIRRRETTMEAFVRLTNMPWIPFNDDGTPIAVEQRCLFLEMEKRYSRSAKPSSPNGYNNFHDAWNAEAAR
jgi:hypothetical protein